MTYFRLTMVPLFVAAFSLRWYTTALVLFFLAGFTDLVDGAIARWLNQRSDLGAVLDPVADKLLMWAAFYCLATVRILPWWLFWLMVVKDAVVVGGIAYLKWRAIPFAYEPILWSKWATLAQIVTGTFGLIDFTFPGHAFWRYPVADFVSGGIYITGCLILITALEYSRKGLEIIQQRQGTA
ncbi:MAG: CDP-alcohol phosphatidyltransferase family protein [Deltaproteobacteria bacterium]|nr:CDP-alcohol phosphatidyltransferase family protein [Deltaproteobacteria bacterium]